MTWESVSMFVLIPVIGLLLLANGWFFKRLFDGLERKITTFCTDNKREHEQIEYKLEHHGHTCCADQESHVYITGDK